jgi:hypothetical protein
MRFVLIFALTTLTAVPLASAAGDKLLDTQEIAALESRAAQAAPKEQCFLYAELVRSMTELAGQQLNAGDREKASMTLKAVQDYVQKIHLDVANNAKKLKTAEITMQRTAYRLKELMLGASLDDRPTLEATLKQLDQVHSEMMMEVFKH